MDFDCFEQPILVGVYPRPVEVRVRCYNDRRAYDTVFASACELLGEGYLVDRNYSWCFAGPCWGAVNFLIRERPAMGGNSNTMFVFERRQDWDRVRFHAAQALVREHGMAVLLT